MPSNEEIKERFIFISYCVQKYIFKAEDLGPIKPIYHHYCQALDLDNIIEAFKPRLNILLNFNILEQIDDIGYITEEYISKTFLKFDEMYSNYGFPAIF